MKLGWKAVGLLAMGMLGADGAQASLISVGTGLVYDNVANVTWSSDANLFLTMARSMMGYANLVNAIIAAVPTVHDTPNTYDTPANSGNYNLRTTDFFGGTSGGMNWWGGMAFMAYLNSIHYLSHNTWMLPTTYNQTCSNYNCTNSMLGELFYIGLGGMAGQPITNSHNTSYSLFTNVQNNAYWSGTEYAFDLIGAWSVYTYNGFQSADLKAASAYSLWAVLPGNAAAVPEPAGLALFGIGLLGLMAGRRHGRFG